MSPVRRRILPALLVLALGLALGPTGALARDTEKSWEIGGYTIVSRYAGRTHIDNGVGWGVRGGYHLKAIHEIEGSYDQVSPDSITLSGISYDITEYSVDYLRNFLVKGHEKMVPFASFGVGNINIDNGSDSLSSTTERFGGGFKYFIKPRGGFRFDLKIFHWRGDGTVVTRDPFFSMDITFAATFLVGGAK